MCRQAYLFQKSCTFWDAYLGGAMFSVWAAACAFPLTKTPLLAVMPAAQAMVPSHCTLIVALPTTVNDTQRCFCCWLSTTSSCTRPGDEAHFRHVPGLRVEPVG